MHQGFAAFNRSVAACMDAAGTGRFPERFGEALRALVDFDILMVFAYAGSARPVCLHHNMDAGRARTVIEAYASGPYLLDPFFAAALDPAVAGLRRLRDMAPDHFAGSEYFRRHYVLTGIRDEIGIVCRPGTWSGVVASFTRPVGRPAFGRQDLSLLEAAEPVLRRLAERHWRGSGPPAPHPAGIADPVEEAVDRMTRRDLTPREAEVTSLVLKGHSSRSGAARLGITEGTVKIHRKNIHQKLGVSSQSELFALFISHLSDR